MQLISCEFIEVFAEFSCSHFAAFKMQRITGVGGVLEDNKQALHKCRVSKEMSSAQWTIQLYLHVSGLLLLHKQKKSRWNGSPFLHKEEIFHRDKNQNEQYKKFGEYGGYSCTSNWGRPRHCTKCRIYSHLTEILHLSLLLYTFWTPGLHQ